MLKYYMAISLWQFTKTLRTRWRFIFANVIRCCRLRFEQVILSILNLHLCSFTWCFYWIFFSSIKGINRLISKGMSNIYLKVTIEKNWRSQNNFLSSKNLSSGQSSGSSNSRPKYTTWLIIYDLSDCFVELIKIRNV